MIIDLVGRKGAGKDTIADYLVSNHGFVKFAFADPVKKVCETLFALSPTCFQCPLKKEQITPTWGLSPRQMMQKVGTDMVRAHLGEDFWIRHLQVRLASLAPGTKVVISDVRFTNEADFVRSLPDSCLLRVDRVTTATSDTCSDTHVSETEQCSIETYRVVKNDMGEGGLSKLYHQCDCIVSDFSTKSV